MTVYKCTVNHCCEIESNILHVNITLFTCILQLIAFRYCCCKMYTRSHLVGQGMSSNPRKDPETAMAKNKI